MLLDAPPPATAARLHTLPLLLPASRPERFERRSSARDRGRAGEGGLTCEASGWPTDKARALTSAFASSGHAAPPSGCNGHRSRRSKGDPSGFRTGGITLP